MYDPNAVDFIAKAISQYGIDPSQTIDVNDPLTRLTMAIIIAGIEQGDNVYSYDQFIKGCAMSAGIDPATFAYEINPTSMGVENNSNSNGFVSPIIPSIASGGSSTATFNVSPYVQIGIQNTLAIPGFDLNSLGLGGVANTLNGIGNSISGAFNQASTAVSNLLGQATTAVNSTVAAFQNNVAGAVPQVFGSAPGATGVFGDSIAVGTAAALNAAGSTVSSLAKEGINSATALGMLRQDPAQFANTPNITMSLGSNDDTPASLAANLKQIIDTVGPDKNFTFILPANKPENAAVIQAFADSLPNAKTVTFAAGSDGVHPASYTALASDVNSAAATLSINQATSNGFTNSTDALNNAGDKVGTVLTNKDGQSVYIDAKTGTLYPNTSQADVPLPPPRPPDSVLFPTTAPTPPTEAANLNYTNLSINAATGAEKWSSPYDPNQYITKDPATNSYVTQDGNPIQYAIPATAAPSVSLGSYTNLGSQINPTTGQGSIPAGISQSYFATVPLSAGSNTTPFGVTGPNYDYSSVVNGGITAAPSIYTQYGAPSITPTSFTSGFGTNTGPITIQSSQAPGMFTIAGAGTMNVTTATVPGGFAAVATPSSVGTFNVNGVNATGGQVASATSVTGFSSSQTDVLSLQATLQTNQNQLNAVTSDLATAQARYAVLSNPANSIGTVVDPATRNSEISALQTQISTLTTQKADLTITGNSLEGQIAVAQSSPAIDSSLINSSLTGAVNGVGTNPAVSDTLAGMPVVSVTQNEFGGGSTTIVNGTDSSTSGTTPAALPVFAQSGVNGGGMTTGIQGGPISAGGFGLGGITSTDATTGATSAVVTPPASGTSAVASASNAGAAASGTPSAAGNAAQAASAAKSLPAGC